MGTATSCMPCSMQATLRDSGRSVRATPHSATAATSCLAAEVAGVHSGGKGFSVLAGCCGQALRVEVCLAINGLGALLWDSKVHQCLHRTKAHNMSASLAKVPWALVCQQQLGKLPFMHQHSLQQACSSSLPLWPRQNWRAGLGRQAWMRCQSTKVTCVFLPRPLASSHGCSMPFWMNTRSAGMAGGCHWV